MEGVEDGSGGTSTPGQPLPIHLAQPSAAAILWTDELHADFVQAVEKCGGASVARPKNIKSFMRSKSVTTTQIKSHLQRHRQRLLARTATAADVPPGQAQLLRSYGAQPPLPLGRDLPQQLPGWFGGGEEEAAGSPAYKRMRPAPQLAASLGMLHSLLGQHQQLQAAAANPQEVQQPQQPYQQHPAQYPQPKQPYPQHTMQQQQHHHQKQQLVQPHFQRWQGGDPRLEGSSHATNTQQQLPAGLQAVGSMVRLAATSAGGGGGGEQGSGGRGGSAANKAATGPAWDIQVAAAANKAQSAAPPAAASALASWLAALVPLTALVDQQAGGGPAPPLAGRPGPGPVALEGQAADTTAAAAPATGPQQAFRSWTPSEEAAYPGAAATGPREGEGPTLALLQGVALLASEQYQVQQEIAEHVQALQGLHARLDSLSANMLELVSLHHAQGQQAQQGAQVLLAGTGSAAPSARPQHPGLASLLQLVPLLSAAAPSAQPGQQQGGERAAGSWALQQPPPQQPAGAGRSSSMDSLWQQIRELASAGPSTVRSQPAQRLALSEPRAGQESGPLFDSQSLALLQQLVPKFAWAAPSSGQEGGTGAAASKAPDHQQPPLPPPQQQQPQQEEALLKEEGQDDREETGASSPQQAQQAPREPGRDPSPSMVAAPGNSHTSPRAGAGRGPGGGGAEPPSSDGNGDSG